MAKLPFIVEPRRKPITEKIGNDESGVIEIERKGYLTTGEKAFVQQVQQFDNGTGEIVTVSRRIARKYSLAMDKAYSLVLKIISGQDADKTEGELIESIEQDFAEDLTAIVKGLTAGQTREDLVLAACMIRYRIDENFEINDVSALHPDIISGLASLYRDEDRRSLEAFEKSGDNIEKPVSIEEAEKKPVRASTSRSTNTTGD